MCASSLPPTKLQSSVEGCLPAPRGLGTSSLPFVTALTTPHSVTVYTTGSSLRAGPEFYLPSCSRHAVYRKNLTIRLLNESVIRGRCRALGGLEGEDMGTLQISFFPTHQTLQCAEKIRREMYGFIFLNPFLKPFPHSTCTVYFR